MTTDKRQRSEKHLRWIKERPCLICQSRIGVDPHHLLTGPEPRSLGLKASDRYTIPLCRVHHDALHTLGDERTYLGWHGVDPIEAANHYWRRSPANKEDRKWPTHSTTC